MEAVFLDSDLAVEKGTNYAVLHSAIKTILAVTKDSEGFAPITAEDLFTMTGLTRRQQDLVLGKMVEEGVITIKKKGLPAKRYFRLNYGGNEWTSKR